ncbi:PREDICTED: protein CYR61-like [Poecilia mexicana]|uniref:protein CYR61-like n=1 Tax=Poecilia mexicana TaxID=48701 RepID=UPI00072E9512|nr:PREDICTED: protein CYR61-like [Poecilia mexicana]
MWKIFVAVTFCFTLVSASCPEACQCPPDVPVCAAGVSLMLDSCGCCKICGRQLYDDCSKTQPCDTAKGLECNFGGKSDLAPGICRAKSDGRSCEFNGRMFQNGETFQPNCKYQCTCMDGSVGCVSLCTRDLSTYRVGCEKPKRVKVKGQCCEQLICLYDANTGRSGSRKRRRKYKQDPSDGAFSNKNHPPHVWEGELTAFRSRPKRLQTGVQCRPQTTAWSPCSKSCGRGVSSRMTNKNIECKLATETQICEIKPCKEIPHKGAGKCQGKAVSPIQMSYGGCHRLKTFQPKLCRSCSDGRFCRPHRTRTPSVRFKCKSGQTFRKKVAMTGSCLCDLDFAKSSKKLLTLYGRFNTIQKL